jgi:formate dehydrogenase iron-sulfur subunit
VKIYVPRDAAALGVGADQTAQAIVAEARRRGIAIELIRNGSRGLLWLEPLVEVDVGGTRMAYGPVQAQDVAGLFDADFMSGKPHALSHGATAEMPYLKRQERLTFARVGITDPRSLEDYKEHGGAEARGHRRERHRIRPARPWRSGLSGRDQVEDRPQHARRAEVHRLQRR